MNAVKSINQSSSSLGIDKAVISQMLLALGADLTSVLAPSYILGATDVIIATELANALPKDANFSEVFSSLHTFNTDQPELVRSMQSKVFEAVSEVSPPVMPGRYEIILSRINA